MRIDNIESLRGLAAIFVVISHIPFVGKGGFGVDLFFIISGFIMVYVTQFNQKDFLVKRFFRVVPAYWFITLLLVLILIYKPNVFSSTEFSIVYLFKSLFFIPFDKNGYMEPLLGVGWTLNYEMFYYFIFYISFKVSVRYRSYIASGIITALVVVGLFNKGGGVFEFYTNPILMEFILGMLLAELYIKDARLAPSKLFAIILQIFLITLLVIFKGKAAGDLRVVVWGLPAALFFYITVNCSSGFLFTRFMSRIGVYSYSLYLTHIFIVLAVHRLIFKMDEFSLISSMVALLTVILALFVGKLYWFLIEARTAVLYKKVRL